MQTEKGIVLKIVRVFKSFLFDNFRHRAIAHSTSPECTSQKRGNGTKSLFPIFLECILAPHSHFDAMGPSVYVCWLIDIQPKTLAALESTKRPSRKSGASFTSFFAEHAACTRGDGKWSVVYHFHRTKPNTSASKSRPSAPFPPSACMRAPRGKECANAKLCKPSATLLPTPMQLMCASLVFLWVDRQSAYHCLCRHFRTGPTIEGKVELFLTPLAYSRRAPPTM